MKLHSETNSLIRILSYTLEGLRLAHHSNGEMLLQTRNATILVNSKGTMLEWPQEGDAGLDGERVLSAFDEHPEVILIGTGATLRFLPTAQLIAFMHARVGFEQMDSAAACRTFNILAQEGRHVVLILLATGLQIINQTP